jgi:phage-related protein
VSRPPFNLLSVVSNLERHKIASGEPWLLLMDLAWPGVNPITDSHVRLVRNLDPVTFDAGDGNGPQVYSPFNFNMGDLAVSSNGSVPECEVQASNVLRALQQTIEQYAGVVGAALDLYAVNAANPAGEPDLALSFTVKQTVSDAKLVHFKLGASSPLRRLFPIHMFRPNFCIWQYNAPALQQATAAAIAASAPLKDPLGAQCGYAGTSFTGNITSGSAVVTSISSMTGIVVGYGIWGLTGIPAGAYAVSISGSTLTMSANATATATGAALNASMLTCSHTIDGTTGCEAHNNLIRIGTFPGIDTNGAAAGTVA